MVGSVFLGIRSWTRCRSRVGRSSGKRRRKLKLISMSSSPATQSSLASPKESRWGWPSGGVVPGDQRRSRVRVSSATETLGPADGASPTPGSSSSWKSMEMEIQSLLEKLLDRNDSMSRCAASALPTSSVTQKLSRHRDILHDFTQEFKRIKGNINSMREHAELLCSVREDISEYKASGSVSPRMQLLRERAAIHGSISHASGSVSPRMQLLRERAAIHGSISHIDDVINQAQATRAVLSSQRTLFGDAQGKVKQLADKFPVIRGLIGSIRRKRSRDTLILSAVIASCILFLIIYWFSK